MEHNKRHKLLSASAMSKQVSDAAQIFHMNPFLAPCLSLLSLYLRSSLISK